MNKGIIHIGDKSYKKCKVIMLPTEKATAGCILADQVMHKLRINIKGEDYQYSPKNFIPQHLYILSNEEIKKGDWVIDYRTMVPLVHQFSIDFKDDKVKKIIASTDPELKLPRPSDAFLKAYCEKGGIDEVLVEYFGWKDCPKGYSTMEESSWGEKFVGKLKVVPDNTITIKSLKDNSNKEELREVLQQFHPSFQIFLQSHVGNTDELIEQWMEKNL